MEYKTNSYVDKMFCINCNKCHCRSKTCYDKGCQKCGKTLFGKNTVNVYTEKIPPKVNFSYVNSLFPTNYPYVYYYGSYKNKLINY